MYTSKKTRNVEVPTTDTSMRNKDMSSRIVLLKILSSLGFLKLPFNKNLAVMSTAKAKYRKQTDTGFRRHITFASVVALLFAIPFDCERRLKENIICSVQKESNQQR